MLRLSSIQNEGVTHERAAEIFTFKFKSACYHNKKVSIHVLCECRLFKDRPVLFSWIQITVSMFNFSFSQLTRHQSLLPKLTLTNTSTFLTKHFPIFPNYLSAHSHSTISLTFNSFSSSLPIGHFSIHPVIVISSDFD